MEPWQLRCVAGVLVVLGLAAGASALRPVGGQRVEAKAAAPTVEDLELERARAELRVEKLKAEKEDAKQRFIEDETWRRVREERVVESFVQIKGLDHPDTKKIMQGLYDIRRPQVAAEIELLDRCTAIGIRLGASKEAILNASERMRLRFGPAGAALTDEQLEQRFRGELDLERLRAGRGAPR
jgi:hypothetical protein